MFWRTYWFADCRRFIVTVLAISLSTVALSAEESGESGPITLKGLRSFSVDETEFFRCTSGEVPERCWACKDHVCVHSERLAYSGWSVTSSASASADIESLNCEVAAQSIRVSFNYLRSPSQVTIQVPGKRHIVLHESRPVYLYIGGERFTNLADGPYLKMEFQDENGSVVDRHKLVEKMKSEYRITVESWNVDDEKVSTVDLVEGLDHAIRHCDNFAATASADAG